VVLRMFIFYPLVLMGCLCYGKPNGVVRCLSNKLILIDIRLSSADALVLAVVRGRETCLQLKIRVGQHSGVCFFDVLLIMITISSKTRVK
jgi:hypothetical protein